AEQRGLHHDPFAIDREQGSLVSHFQGAPPDPQGHEPKDPQHQQQETGALRLLCRPRRNNHHEDPGDKRQYRGEHEHENPQRIPRPAPRRQKQHQPPFLDLHNLQPAFRGERIDRGWCSLGRVTRPRLG
ncbi:MAG: hypothetical protein ACK559_09565, partial [bacterium]